VEVITEFHTGGSDDKIAVDRKTLLEAIKQEGKKNEVITIYKDDNHSIRVGGFKLGIEPIDVDRFTPEHVAMQKVSLKELIEAFSHVVYVAKETYSTKDVVFIPNGKVFYASDNYRLARYEIKEGYDFPEEICVSGSAARLLVEAVRILKETVGEIGIADEMIVVRLGRYTIGMKKEQCAFPAYEAILAKEHKTVVYVKAKEMINALKQIKKIDKVKFVHIEINPDNTRTMKLYTRDIDGGVGSLIDIPVVFDNRENERVEKAFNIQYLLDALNPVEKELVAICDPGDGNDWIDIIWNGYRAMIMAAVLM
jgi:DNA polymerase III sliding clamp (beta) subunit (PCNA family)